MPLLNISIVIGGDENLIIPCLQSIFAFTKLDFEVVVVANKASQFIVNKIKKNFPMVDVIENTIKKGFASNHNQVIRQCNGKYILILNDDTLIVEDAVDRMVDFMECHPEAGVVGCKLLNSDGSLQPSTYGLPTIPKILMDLSGIKRVIPNNEFTRRWISKTLRHIMPREFARFWKHDTISEVESVKGACMVIRKSALDDVGLMDETTLVYGEELEWHIRFQKKGWKIYFLPDAIIIHYGKKTTERMEISATFEQLKGILNIYNKHYSRKQFVTLKVALISILMIKILILSILFFPIGAIEKRVKEYKNMHTYILRRRNE